MGAQAERLNRIRLDRLEKADLKTVSIMGSKLVIPVIALVCVMVAAPRVYAHAFPTRETPGAGAVLDTPPRHVTIKFDAPIQKLFAKLSVVNKKADNFTSGPPNLSTDSRKLSVKLKSLPPGQYRVHWSVVATDGHRTHGSYVFTVAKHAE